MLFSHLREYFTPEIDQYAPPGNVRLVGKKAIKDPLVASFIKQKTSQHGELNAESFTIVFYHALTQKLKESIQE